MPAGPAHLGVNLTNDHPVSFVYDNVTATDDGELVAPVSLPADIRLYEGATPGVRNSVQCVSCHDPHTDPPTTLTTRMISFHPNVRPIGGRARPEWWLDTATRERRCYLQCHTVTGGIGGEIMNGESGSGGKRAQYRPAAGGDVP
jgi:hypothetical protein